MRTTQSPAPLLTVGLALWALAAPLDAQQVDRSGESRNLFETASAKQSAADFEPAPLFIRTGFGDLDFSGGGFPSDETAEKLYYEMDLQRATQAYMDFFPAQSVYAIVKAQIRDIGFRSPSDVGVFADLMGPSENYLTGNDVTLYAVASLDLKLDGPTVVEIPAGMYGTANDAAFKFLVDFGFVGPDKGDGGQYLFLPPGYQGAVPDDYFVVRSPSYRIWAMMRGFGEIGTGDAAVDYFRQGLKIYPLATGPRSATYTNISGIGLNTLPPEDGSYFRELDEIIQYEPTELFDAEQLGRLATLGIRKGFRFDPDPRMNAILDQGAKQGVAMSRAIVYSSRDPDILVWPDRRWEEMFVRNTEFVVDGFNDVDARTLWHYQAIVVSPNLISTTPGSGTSYITTFRDGNGVFLDGAREYRLRVPANAPAQRFWAVTAYDPASRSLLDSGGPITVSSLGDPEMNRDGSVDVYFGPTPPAGHEKNWVHTHPDTGYFLVFRFYGPLEGIIEKTWTLGDLEPVR